MNLIGRTFKGDFISALAIVNTSIGNIEHKIKEVLDVPESPAEFSGGEEYQVYIVLDKAIFTLDEKVKYVLLDELLSWIELVVLWSCRMLANNPLDKSRMTSIILCQTKSSRI